MNAIMQALNEIQLRFIYLINRVYFLIFNRFFLRKVGMFNRINEQCNRLIRLIDSCEIMNSQQLRSTVFVRWETIFFLICAQLGLNYKAAELLYENHFSDCRDESGTDIHVFRNKLRRYSRYWTLSRLIDLHNIFYYASEVYAR